MLPENIDTDVLVVGGGFAGLSAVRTLQIRFLEYVEVCKSKKETPSVNKLKIHMVEPRSGLLNILGMLKCLVDLQFAQTQYIDFTDLHVPWTEVILQYPTVMEKYEMARKEIEKQKAEIEAKNNVDVQISFIHGRVDNLSLNLAHLTLERPLAKEINGETPECPKQEGTINFKYVILASGRDRSWPATPLGQTKDIFLLEMKKFHDSLIDKKIITVVGGGAVGVEFAGDLKHHFPGKTVQLVHPHEKFPPEPLTDAFKDLVKQSLESSGVKVIRKRISKQLEDGNLVTTDGDVIESDFVYWATSHKNNTTVLVPELQLRFVNKANNILVNDYLQLSNTEITYSHFFAIGDLIEKKMIIKSAGWAIYMGRASAHNVISLIVRGETVEPFPDVTKMPRGMVMVAGNGDIVLEITGEALINPPHYVEEYKDYCFGKVRVTINV